MLVALDLESRELVTLHQTAAQIQQFWFDAEGRDLIVAYAARTAQTEKKATRTTHGRRMLFLQQCHLSRDVEFDPSEDGLEVIRIALAKLNDTEEREERIEYGPEGCVADSRVVQAHSSMGGYLVVTLFDNASEVSDIIGGGFSLSLAYSWLRIGRFTLMPDLGTKLLLTEIDFSKRAPPLALPLDVDWSGGTSYQSLAWLLDTGMRLEVGLLRFRGDYESRTDLTLGSYLGWEQQVASTDWRIYDDTTNQPRANFSQPRLSHSGPLGFLYLGVRVEQF